MARPKPIFTPDPRIWTGFQVACRLNRSEQWLASNRAALEGVGFPKKDKLLGGWDADQIEAWLDNRSGKRHASDIEQQMLEAVRGQNPPALRSTKRSQGAHILPLQAERPAHIAPV